VDILPSSPRDRSGPRVDRSGRVCSNGNVGLAQRFRRSLRSRGLRKTIWIGLKNVVEPLRLALSPTERKLLREQREFDRRYGTDTALEMYSGLEYPEGAGGQLHGYQATRPAIFEEIVARLPDDLRALTFVDIGCGKGRVPLMASLFPFRRIIGVELSPRLVEIARRNVAIFESPEQRCGEIDLVCADATRFELPEEPLVIYLFNPFGPEPMGRFLGRVRASIEAAPRPVFVAYVPGKEGFLPEQAESGGFLRCIGKGPMWAVYEATS